MKITKITWQMGNDFKGVMECEHCGATEKLLNGYNDTYFHQTVIPNKHCSACGKNRAGDLRQAAE